MHNPPQLIVAEVDAGLPMQMGVQPGQRPDAEAVPQFLRGCLQGRPQRGAVGGGGSRRAPRRLSGHESGQAVPPVASPDVVHCPDAATQIDRNRRFRPACSAHQNDRCVAKHRRIAGPKPQFVQGIPRLVGQFPCRHDRLLAIRCHRSAARSLTFLRTPQKIFCGST